MKYNTVPLFIGQPVKPVRRYLNPEFDEFWNQWNRSLTANLDTWTGYRLFIKSKFAALNGHWPTPAPLRLVFMAGLLGLSPPVLTLLMAGFVCGITLMTREPMLAHYSSPGGALFFLIAVMALRRLNDWKWRRWAVGRAAVAITLASCLFNSWNAYADYPRGALNPCGRVKEEFREHARIQYGDGKHLVFVRYRSTHFAQQGWTYNEADMDASSVIWARELSRDENCRLARYYKDRTDWLLKAAGPKADFTLVDPCR